MVRTLIATIVVGCSAVTVADNDLEPWVLPEHGFPIVTEGMRPGIGDIRIKLSYDVLKSVAVVGADNISARWLKLNNAYLVDTDTVGIVVNVKNEAALNTLREYTDIPLIAMPGDSLIEHFGRIYPFVVDKQFGVVRQ